MYSTASDGNVTLQLKEPDDLDRNSLAAMLARLQEDASFSIYTQDADILSDGSIDVLLGTGSSTGNSGTDTVTASFDFFDSSSAQDLTLSPQTLSNTTEALVNDNSNSLGLSADSDAVSTTTKDDGKPGTTSPELKGKRPKTKPTSPNRQGPQQCQVCSKVFGNASALAKHKLTHSDERKYVCNVCNKAFKRQDHLNGHMLTHRNKKPYECKADGCGKSYCDARSLRRHTENHHVSPAAASSSTTTMSPAQGAATGDAASPHGSSCIQYAPPPSGSPTLKESGGNKDGKSQLQQLLSTEPAKNSTGSNDGLTKQQLDLIHQIMEQTQRQNQVIATSPSSSKSSPKKLKSSSGKIKDKTVAPASSTSWSPNSQQQCTTIPIKTISTGAPSPQSKVTTTTPSAPSPTTPDKPILKPVECNLCKRRFKNIPALNGHMRLHGGYFKKDPDSKKVDKKEQTGPPLQTASSSVRALIEEKIISKRNSSPSTTHHHEPVTHTSSATQVDMDAKISSFVVPAPPQPNQDKNRRHSDAEAFKNSKSYQEAQAVADLILKREKISVKRTTSDPGQSSSHLLQYRADSFSLDSVDMYQNEEPHFVTPSLEDEVFSNNSMMLQGVDPNQLSQIPFQSESLDDNLLQIKEDNLLHIKDENLLDMKNEGEEQLQELSLDDIASLHEEPMTITQHTINPVNQELQAVLNSPLPESLAEFSTYHTSKNLEIQSPSYHTQSPVSYAKSPHTYTVQSPLQSPMVRHDSPGFAYPTPPASHEGQSPCFGQNLSVPLVSPSDDFGQVVERGLDEPPQASSPLSAAFYTSTMSSSAAVEEAIQEILPGESITEDSLYPLSNTPPSQSENDSLGLSTPVPSPRIVSTSIPSPHPGNSFSPSPKTSCSTSALGTQWGTATTLMLPNSDDPLLSSQPKDFVPKKRIQLNGVPVRLISNNGLIELNSTNFTGLLLDANGEIKLIQTGTGGLPAKNFVMTNAQLVTTTTSNQDPGNKDKPKIHKVTVAKAVQHPSSIKLVRTKTVIDAKKDECNDIFLSPTTIPTASPIKPSRKRLRTEPLQLPVFHQSKLRATRSKPQGAARYTPQPILNPQRTGTGLYTNIKQKSSEDGTTWNSDPIPETDSTPHINIGSQYQCSLPSYKSVPRRISPEPAYEDLLWDPGIGICTDSEVDMYLEFACCAAIPGGGRNKEYAMHLLHMCGGNIHEAMLRLMQPSPSLPADHPLLAYSYSESDKWTSAETELFHRCLMKFDKDFNRISEEVKTKTVKQCVQFYYVWKKVCADEYGRLKAIRQMKRNHKNVLETDDKPYPDVRLLGIADSESPMRNFLCEYPDCSASFNSRAALNGHIRIHGGTARTSPTPSNSERRHASSSTNTSFSVTSTVCHPDSTDQEYPCKICGKVFPKIKSRSAHMKSHRPPDAEPSKRRNSEAREHKEPKEVKDFTSNGSYELSVPSPFSL
ncbi:flocculation protein FLO11 isoform X2 [Sitophilus oryzae]|uniref:Flocculation protein FLO11 isoform X2 n=1 Tax=Sitophilus oryzae TaxID=7048 RepID=A0A6J2YLR0_SITOR|nr:flocculation protein FLO11 isoform X2 [Sitophilus oryzae]